MNLKNIQARWAAMRSDATTSTATSAVISAKAPGCEPVSAETSWVIRSG